MVYCFKKRHKSIGYKKKWNFNSIQYIGIAKDEQSRANKNDIRYSLIEWGMTQKDCLKYCYSKGFNWNGFYEKFSRASCWCCALQKIGELRILYNDFLELWKQLEEMDKKSFRKLKNKYTVKTLSKRFANEYKYRREMNKVVKDNTIKPGTDIANIKNLT